MADIDDALIEAESMLNDLTRVVGLAYIESMDVRVLMVYAALLEWHIGAVEASIVGDAAALDAFGKWLREARERGYIETTTLVAKKKEMN
jgi:hypothetical protein